MIRRPSPHFVVLFAMAAPVGLCHCQPSDEGASQSQPSAASSPPGAPATSASSSPSSASPSTSADELPALNPDAQIAEFCDLMHGAHAMLSPTSKASESVTRTNPMTGQPSTYRPRKLTPEQHEAARAVLEPIKRAEIRDDCHVLELEPGTRLVMVGLESACESGCRFHARQLNPVAAKLIFDLATKASMTIDVNDHVFVPEGVKSEHVGESYTTVVSTPDELSDKVTTPFVGGLTQYRGPVRNAP